MFTKSQSLFCTHKIAPLNKGFQNMEATALSRKGNSVKMKYNYRGKP